MNKIDFNQTGGHPLHLEDFAFLQNASIDAFKAIANILQEPQSSGLTPTYIITGCVKTNPVPGTWAISEGYVVIAGEIYYVPSHSISYVDVNAPLYWTVEQTNETPSPLEYKDFSIKNVHFSRVAKLTTTLTSTVYNPAQNVAQRIDMIHRGVTGSLTLLNGWDGALEYRVIAGRVTLYGSVLANSNTIQSAVISNLPAEICPWVRIYDDYCGVGAATNSTIAGIVAADVALNGGNLHPAIRLQRNSGDNNILATAAWPIQLVPQNLTSAAPRTAQLRVWNPVNIPAGFDYVVYNLNGISWDIAPRQ